MKNEIKNVTDLMQTNQTDFVFILQKVKKLQQINREFLQYLDKGLAKNCQVANIAGTELIILVPNAAVATEIRYLTPELLSKFKANANLRQIRQIKCIVRPNDMTKAKPTNPPKMQWLSTETTTVMKEIADTIPDEKCRKIIQKIASHKREK